MNILRLALLVAVSAMWSYDLSGQTLNWYKGNTHAHTLNSDGDSTSADVVKWYRENRYNFLFLTDHEYVNDVEALNGVYGKAGSFIVLSGQEVTDSFDKKPYHINALGISKVVMPSKLPGAVETLQKNIDNVVNIGGVAQVNHPNFGWALTAEHLIKLQNYSLLEIHNGHPLVNNKGGGGVPSAEEMWDSVLTKGKLVFGVADDDSHYFKWIGDLCSNAGTGLDICPCQRVDSRGDSRRHSQGQFLCFDWRRTFRLSSEQQANSCYDQGTIVQQIPHPVYRPRRPRPERVGIESCDVLD